MAFRTHRPCRKAGCPELVNGSEPYCPQHAREARRAVDAQRGSSADRGYDQRWRTIRALFLSQHPSCPCGDRATEVDHVVPLRKGGTNDAGNLQALCRRCHASKTSTLDGGFGRRAS